MQNSRKTLLPLSRLSIMVKSIIVSPKEEFYLYELCEKQHAPFLHCADKSSEVLQPLMKCWLVLNRLTTRRLCCVFTCQTGGWSVVKAFRLNKCLKKLLATKINCVLVGVSKQLFHSRDTKNTLKTVDVHCQMPGLSSFMIHPSIHLSDSISLSNGV